MLEVATRPHPTTPKNHRTHQGMRIRQTGKSSLVLSGSPDSWLQPSSVVPWKPHLPLRLILKGGAYPLLREDVNLSGDGIVSPDLNVFQLVEVYPRDNSRYPIFSVETSAFPLGRSKNSRIRGGRSRHGGYSQLVHSPSALTGSSMISGGEIQYRPVSYKPRAWSS